MRPSLVILVAVCACTSGGTTPGTRTPRAETIRSEGLGSLTITPVTDASSHLLTAAVDDAWIEMADVYDSLAIPKALIDPQTHTISNQGQKIRQRLGRTPLSRFIDCGNTQIGPNADSYEVFLTVTTQLTAAGTGSKLSTTVEAVARPLAFNQTYSRCASKGVLETRIADALKARLPQ